jgi:hypothetical protein
MFRSITNKFFKTKPTDVPVILQHEYAGHKFYVLDPVKMPNIRRMNLFNEEYARDWGITKKDLQIFLGSILRETEFPKEATIQDLNAELSDKLKKVYSLTSLLHGIISQDVQIKPFVRSACMVIVVDDEPIDKIDPKYTDLKLQLCERYTELEAFFLQVICDILNLIKNSSNTSTQLDWYNLANQKRMEKRLYNGIGSTIYSDMVSSETKTLP